MMRATAIAQFGAFDERFFLYAQETDWCYRAGQAGWSIYYVPAARAIHLGGQSTIAMGPTARYLLLKERVVFAAKHYGHNKAKALASSLRLVLAVRRILQTTLEFLDSNLGSKNIELQILQKMMGNLASIARSRE